MMEIELTEEMKASIIEEATRRLVERIISESSLGCGILSRAQAAGILNVDQKTLDASDIPRLPMAGHRVVRYRVKDIEEFIKKNIA